MGHDDVMTSYSQSKEFAGASFDRCSFKGARMRNSNFSGVTMRAASLDGLHVDDHDLFFGTLIVNGVDVVPLVDAELNRLFPGRELQKATTPEGLREGWQKVQAAWAETVGATPAELREVSVDDEWSLAQTLRHLVLATDAWQGKGIRRDEQPFHPIGQVFAGYAESGYDMSVFREPTGWDEILDVRAERQQQVTDYLAGVTQAELDAPASNPWGDEDDWVPTAGDCIRVILEEEWAHLRYARRDLATLQAPADEA